MKYRWLLLPISLTIVLSLIFFHLISSQYPERIGFYVLQKAVRRSNGNLSVETFHGNFKKGLTLENVSFTNDSLTFKAATVTLRMRTTPLLFGVIFLKEMTVMNAEAVIKESTQDGRPPKNTIPVWLTAYSKKTTILFDRLEIEDKKNGPLIMEQAELEAAASVKLGKINLKDLRLRVERSPLGLPASFNGSLGFKPGTWLNCDGFFSAGRSRGAISANYRLKNKETLLTAGITSAEIFLKDLKALGDLPDLKLDCTAKVSIAGKQVKIKMEVEERGYGKFGLNSEAVIDGGIVKGGGDISAKPFFYSLGIPQLKSDRLKIIGDFRSGFEYNIKERKLKCSLDGKIIDSEVLNIPIDSGESKITLDGAELKVVSTFSSRLAGEGTIEIEHDFESFLTSVRFSSSGTLSKSTVDRLGIEIPLPYPFVFAENLLIIPSAELLLDGENVNIRISAIDRKGGTYRVDCFFRNLEIFDLSLDLSKIEPGMWGFETPFIFSGLLDFSFTEPEFIPAELTGGQFAFEWGELGPVDTTFKILPSGMLDIPTTRVPFTGGYADLLAVISQDGSYKGKGTAVINSYGLAPEKYSNLIKGEISSVFSFDGTFSNINIAGSVKSPLFSYSGIEADSLEIKGSASIEPEKTSLDLTSASASISSKFFSSGRTSLKLSGPLNALQFDLSSALDEERGITLGGVLNFGREEFSSRIEKGTLKAGAKNLYLSGTPEISFRDDLLSWKGLVLLSGESKLTSDGSLSLSRSPGEIDAALSAENFSIVLLPLPVELASLRGKIDADITVKGLIDDPEFTGEALFKNLTFPLKNSDFKIVGMMRLDLDRDTVKFSNCYFSTNDGGDAALAGKVKFKGFYPEEMNISLDAQDFPVVYGKDFEGLVDIGLKLTGSYDEPRVDGNIHFLKGKLQLPEVVKNPELPASITFINETGSKIKFTEKENAFLSKLRGGILFTSKGKVWISRSDIIGELGGRVLVKFTKDGIIPEGNLSILSGRFLLQGSKFDLKDSSLYFSGGRDLYPILDINASKEIDNYEVTIRLQGRVEKPTLTLSSIPPLDEGEVLSLILFGRTSQNLNPEEHAKWGGAAAAIAFNYEATPVIKSVSRALKVDTLLVGTSTSGDPQLGFSKYLSDRVVLEYQQIFGSLPESRVNLRYRINRHLSLDAISSTAGKSGADLTWEQKY